MSFPEEIFPEEVQRNHRYTAEISIPLDQRHPVIADCGTSTLLHSVPLIVSAKSDRLVDTSRGWCASRKLADCGTVASSNRHFKEGG